MTMVDTGTDTPEQPTLRAAIELDAPGLSQLAMVAKAYWGYPAEFMHACRAELTVTKEAIASNENHYVVAMLQQELVGFYSLERHVHQQSHRKIELGALYVTPKHIGRGIGRLLIARAKAHAGTLGARIISIQSDPHALEFYLAVGAVVVGEKESGSIPGRFLPLLEVTSLSGTHSAQTPDAVPLQGSSDELRVDETAIEVNGGQIHRDPGQS